MYFVEYDYQMDIEVQREEAEENGIQIGEQRERQRSAQVTIMKLHQKNWSISDIAEIVEMPEERVREIIASQENS